MTTPTEDAPPRAGDGQASHPSDRERADDERVRERDRPSTDRASTLFFVLWGVATLFHQVSFLRVASDPLQLMLTLAAFLTVAVPRRPTFVLLLAVQIAEALATAPRLSNHAWLLLFAAATMLSTLALGRPRDDASWRRAFTPPIRGLLVALYFWAVFHKLNHDFFDPEVSCAAALYESARAGLVPVLPTGEGAARVAAVATLIIEAAIPALLLAPRTRRAGVLLGAAFHLGVGLVPYRNYFNFSAVLFALFYLQTGDDWLGRARARLLGRATTHLSRPPVRALALLALATWLVGYAVDGPTNRALWDASARVLWLAYAGVGILAYALSA